MVPGGPQTVTLAPGATTPVGHLMVPLTLATDAPAVMANTTVTVNATQTNLSINLLAFTFVPPFLLV